MSLITILNLISLPADMDFSDYTGYDLLQDLGNKSQVSSIRRYDPVNGWQTTSWFFGVPSGVDYETMRGEGYLIYMNEAVENWRP